MKNYEEVTKSVLERSKQIIAQRNKSQGRIMTAIRTSATCLALIGVAGFGVWLIKGHGSDIILSSNGGLPPFAEGTAVTDFTENDDNAQWTVIAIEYVDTDNNSTSEDYNVGQHGNPCFTITNIEPAVITVEDNVYGTETKISPELSEDEFRQGYEEFLKFIDDNNLPVRFDYEDFKQEYYTLGYDGMDDYLESIYGIFDLGSEVTDTEKHTVKEPEFTNDPDDYRAGLAYSDEILDAYEYYTITLTENGIFVEMSLESFVDEYEKSGYDKISEYCRDLIAKCLGNQG